MGVHFIEGTLPHMDKLPAFVIDVSVSDGSRAAAQLWR
jgi:hypothetical protein